MDVTGTALCTCSWSGQMWGVVHMCACMSAWVSMQIHVCVDTQVNMDKDVVVSPMNEYEVLQLLLAECRDRLTAYGSESTSLQTHI